MSDPRHQSWRSWSLAPLSEDTTAVLDAPGDGRPAPKPAARHAEADIAATLFELAKEEAQTKGHADGYEAGYAAGHAEGERQGRAEQAERIEAEIAAALAPMQALVARFSGAIDTLDDEIGADLSALVLQAAEHLAGRALKLAPEQILEDIRGLMQTYPSLAEAPTIHVADADHACVVQHLGATLEQAGWGLRVDETLAVGDLYFSHSERDIEQRRADRLYALARTLDLPEPPAELSRDTHDA